MNSEPTLTKTANPGHGFRARKIDSTSNGKKAAASQSDSDDAESNLLEAKESRDSIPDNDWIPPIDSWKSFQKKIAAGKSLQRLNKLHGNGRESPLVWALPEELAGGETHVKLNDWHRAVCKQKQKKKSAANLIESIAAIDPGELDPESALVAVGSARTLRTIAAHCDEESFRSTIGCLLQIADSSGLCEADQPWLIQLCSVELPLTLAFELPELLQHKLVGKSLAKNAVQQMEKLIDGILDGDGWIMWNYLSVYGPLIATWARSLAMIDKLKLKPGDDARLQLEWLVRVSVAVLRPDRTFAGSGYDSLPASREMIDAVVGMSPDKFDRRVVARCLLGDKRKLDGIPEESSISEWAMAGAMQTHWKPKPGKCALSWGERNCWMEISSQISLIGGDCTPCVSLGDRQLSVIRDVEVVCREHNESGDYLELSFELESNVRLDRQIFLARDNFLFLGDTIVKLDTRTVDEGSNTETLSYQCDFPLAPGVECLPETETREIYLKDRQIRSLVLPLALPEWKAARSQHAIVCDNGVMTLSQTAPTTGMFAGLFIDLSQKRSLKPRTWRPLTVAESLSEVSSDVAVAFRVRVGKQQWVFYKSIQPNSNRSFIGYNFADGFLAGRFLEDGIIESMIETE